jgi:hypothetical protein
MVVVQGFYPAADIAAVMELLLDCGLSTKECGAGRPRNPNDVESQSRAFGGARRMVFNRYCLWRLNPAGTSARDGQDAQKPRSTGMCESGLRWTKRSYGRVCRTADLYHVKADWPHQDARGRRVYVNVEGPLDQSVTCCRLALSGIFVAWGPRS